MTSTTTNTALQFSRHLHDGHWHVGCDGRVAVRGWARCNGTYLEGEAFARRALAEVANLRQFVEVCEGHFAILVETDDAIVLSVDRHRTFPLLYAVRGRIAAGDDARAVRDAVGLDEVLPISTIEMAMGGLVTGGLTMYKGLLQVNPGSVVRIDRQTGKAGIEIWYGYLPYEEEGWNPEEGKLRLNAELDAAFRELLERRGDRPFVVPLSGGLDSRLVLCKLHEHGCKNLRAFSFGPPNGDEVLRASRVTKMLDVPWEFIPATRKHFRRMYRRESRKAYWRYADSLCAMPLLVDCDIIERLREAGKLPDDAIIVNGQSGDYIVGGHIYPDMAEPGVTRERMAELISKKRYSYWGHLRNPAGLEIIKRRILDYFDYIDPEKKAPAYALTESWDWRERQCRYIVNGVRAYEFLGYDWDMPLWANSLVDYWLTVPKAWKCEKRIYIDYLHDYDYHGVFSSFRPDLSLYNGAGGILGYLGQAIGKVFGGDVRKAYFRTTGYLGARGFQYGNVGPLEFLRSIRHSRNALSFWARTWFEENDIPFPDPPTDADLAKYDQHVKSSESEES